MTERQLKLYRSKWGSVRKLLRTVGEYSAADADAQRMVIHEDVLGSAKSSLDLTQKDFDKVLDAFDAILVLETGPRDSDRSDQPCRRLIYAIEQLGLDEPYIAAIARTQFKTEDWRSLTERQLARFRFTCAARASAKKKKGTNSH